MAAANGQTLGGQLKLYRSATVLADHAIATVEGAATAANEIPNVTDLGVVETTKNITEYSVYGTFDAAKKLVGQEVLSDLTFDVAFDAAETDHTALRDDDGSAERTFIVEVETGTNEETYYAIDGFVAGASLANPYDSQATLSVTVSVTKYSAVDDTN